MTTMDQHRLHQLIDHPAPDPEAPRNPVLTHQVMERVRRAHAAEQAPPPPPRVWPWVLGATLVVLAALGMPTTGLVGDGGMGLAAGLFDRELLLELVVGALLAAALLGATWRRLA
jgi:hypothetical protein